MVLIVIFPIFLAVAAIGVAALSVASVGATSGWLAGVLMFQVFVLVYLLVFRSRPIPWWLSTVFFVSMGATAGYLEESWPLGIGLGLVSWILYLLTHSGPSFLDISRPRRSGLRRRR